MRSKDSSDTLTAVAGTQTPTPIIVTRITNPRTAVTDFQAGITVLIYNNDDHFSSLIDPYLDRVAGLGVNSLSLTIPIFQDSWDSSTVYTKPDKTLSAENLTRLVERAHERGFTIMLRPLLDEEAIARTPNMWRGSIVPTNTDQWFSTYGSILSDYALFAQKEGVDALNIGTELISLERDGHWLPLIDQIRRQYSGQLTYSYNWNSQYPLGSAVFNSQLDFISVDAYYPLDAPDGASSDQLYESWQKWVSTLKNSGFDLQKIVFTEIGLRPTKGAYRKPWLWSDNAGVDPKDQATYYRASCQAWKSLLGGLYWWETGLYLPNGNQVDPNSFSPLGQPAEQEIKFCYSGG